MAVLRKDAIKVIARGGTTDGPVQLFFPEEPVSTGNIWSWRYVTGAALVKVEYFERCNKPTALQADLAIRDFERRYGCIAVQVFRQSEAQRETAWARYALEGFTHSLFKDNGAESIVFADDGGTGAAF